jgi:glycosyltransferase involved in cell wall biosynthesis
VGDLLQVLLLEPFWGGSHRAAAEGWMHHTRHAVTIESLPARFWKWRMRGAALEFARRIESSELRPDVLFASSMLDLAHLKGLLRRPPPALLYFHENQAAYPGRPGAPPAERDLQFAFTNLASVGAADHVGFNSEYQRRAFIEGMASILGRMPDTRPAWILEKMNRISTVLPLGIETDWIPPRSPGESEGAPLVLWNHRWEHDKAPEVFFRVIGGLARERVEFRVAVVGESFRSAPDVFRQAREELGRRVVQWGFLERREDYGALLSRADVVVSTARQENFGLSMVEAAFAGAHPLAPRSLSYPEVFPHTLHSRCLYRDEEELGRMLRQLLTGAAALVPAEDLRRQFSRYDWRVRASDFDRCLVQVSENSRMW